MSEEPRIERLRRLIEEQYNDHPTGCGGSFGELLCWEIHSNGKTFKWLAEKWGISLPTLGGLIWDHCCRLENDPKVKQTDFPPDKYPIPGEYQARLSAELVKQEQDPASLSETLRRSGKISQAEITKARKELAHVLKRSKKAGKPSTSPRPRP